MSRLKKGQVSAQVIKKLISNNFKYYNLENQFWAAYVPCEAQHKDAVQLTLEQIDVILRLTEKYSPQLTTCTSAIGLICNHKLKIKLIKTKIEQQTLLRLIKTINYVL